MSLYRKAFMEDGLSLKEAQGSRTRARRGEQGDAEGFGRRRSGMLSHRDPAPSYGNRSRDPGSWALAGRLPAPEKAVMTGGSQGLPATALPVLAAHRCCCCVGESLQTTHAKSVS